MSSDFRIRWTVLALFSVLFLSGIFSLPVWKRTTYHGLLGERHNLRKKVRELQGRELLLDVESKELLSRVQLEKVAMGHFGLIYDQLPIVVRAN